MRERPAGRLDLRHFERRDEPLRELHPDELLVENVLLSVAPAARAVMDTDTYRPRLVVGETIPSTVIGRVLRTPSGGPAVGSLVAAFGAWEEYSILGSAQVRRLTIPAPLEHYLSVLGQNGLTAYFGLTRIGQVAPGETVVVSGAAGGVGHLAGQIARLLGARVVAITGSAEKNTVLTTQLGYDAAVNRRSATFVQDLSETVPEGIDVYFDNVAGPVTEAILPLMNRHGRIVCSGATSAYDGGAREAPGPAGLALAVITRSLRFEGFLVADFRDEWSAATTVLRDWSSSGRLVPKESVTTGLDSAPAALIDLLDGRNVGQAGVRLRPDPPHAFE
ncbi:NADP-dependent oxidoreductase [Conyzicola nivalis]|uniref:NADP-dependent oxidoreductase n=2 Tax=Conyzicola nivalis TaxID=1477021 RepID=A0A916SP12_9MICO|nr:NADP-dependent oxidoreductase [Conyzicola nivalis]